ncbi:MAG: DUF2249 domain-containing protein [Thermaerobacter sp.]|nr:DUF2249 domain-containing protein [Thermaerobacter sp.]
MRELDVRPVLQAGGEPFEQIMAFVAELPPGEGFRLWATFKPDPLLSVLRAKGYQGDAQEVSPNNWAVDFTPVS